MSIFAALHVEDSFTNLPIMTHNGPAVIIRAVRSEPDGYGGWVYDVTYRMSDSGLTQTWVNCTTTTIDRWMDNWRHEVIETTQV